MSLLVHHFNSELQQLSLTFCQREVRVSLGARVPRMFGTGWGRAPFGSHLILPGIDAAMLNSISGVSAVALMLSVEKRLTKPDPR